MDEQRLLPPDRELLERVRQVVEAWTAEYKGDQAEEIARQIMADVGPALFPPRP